MTNFKKRLLIFILLLLDYTFANAEVIKIPPIVVEAKQENRVDETTNILSNLKKAIAKNQKSTQRSKDDEAKEILERLRASIPAPTHISTHKIKKDATPKRVEKKHLTATTDKKKIVKVKKKAKIAKKVIKKKIVKKRAKVVTLKTKKSSKKQNVHTKNNTSQSTEPIGFVKTLGVVGKSEVYEVNDLIIDKREEVSNDGVVDISTATTDELKGLPFVKPLEVIEVTKPFEASEAKKYQLDKR